MVPFASKAYGNAKLTRSPLWTIGGTFVLQLLMGLQNSIYALGLLPQALSQGQLWRI